jgi:hypothetical protein
MFISGWVLAAYADLGRAATHDELADLLKRQGAAGWWPLFTDLDNDSYASSYATAWVMLGLVAQRERGLIPEQDREAVDSAIARAGGWLLATRQAGSRWSSFPTRTSSKVSESISALAIHALHRAKAGDLAVVDREWLARLPQHAVKVTDSERAYEVINAAGKVRIDHFEQIVLPWMLAALGDAYANGGAAERARALVFLDRALADPGLAAADASENNWWRAELLYGLKSLRRRL